MQHSMIFRAAWALTISLVVVAAAFAWSTNQRERLAAATAAAAPPVAADAAAAPADPAAQRAAVADAWEKRCAKCHDPEEMPEWLATQPGDKVAALDWRCRSYGDRHLSRLDVGASRDGYFTGVLMHGFLHQRSQKKTAFAGKIEITPRI